MFNHFFKCSPFLLLIFLLASCTGTKKSGGGQASDNEFQRQIRPFPVFNSSGSQLQHPFLGGFNNPRPQFVDINGDNDPDLFVQENTNQLIYFENGSDTGSGSLEWQTDRYRDLDIGEWFRFADMDQDGDMDLLTEQPYSYIRYYRNEGSETNPKFTLAADTLRGANGEPIFSDRQNIPNVTDIDCDNRLDLFIGRLDGTVMRYESVGRNEDEIPQFKLVSRQFEGIEIVKQIGTLHGANTLTFVDIDHDNDQDLFWGDFFEPSLLLIRNEGSCGNPVLQGEPTQFPPSNPVESSGYNAPAFTDWGGDGDMDLFVGVLGGAYNANQTLAENFHFYEQGSSGNFKLRTKEFLSAIDIGNESMPATGDLDGDGDTDLLLANKIDPGEQNTSLVYRFENRGSKGNPELHRAGTLKLPNAYHYAPALGDLNGDGLDDLLLGTWKGRIAYYQNTGDGFKKKSDNYLELDRGSNSAPVLADIDSDGDLDLFVGDSGGSIHFYRNEGSADTPDFVLEKESFAIIEAEHRSTPELFDVDGDDDLDLFLGTKTKGLLFFQNTGSAQKANFTAEPLPVSIDAPQLAVPRFTDLDGDEDSDFISGGAGGGLIFYRNMSN